MGNPTFIQKGNGAEVIGYGNGSPTITIGGTALTCAIVDLKANDIDIEDKYQDTDGKTCLVVLDTDGREITITVAVKGIVAGAPDVDAAITEWKRARPAKGTKVTLANFIKASSTGDGINGDYSYVGGWGTSMTPRGRTQITMKLAAYENITA